MSYGATLDWQSMTALKPPSLAKGVVHLWWLDLRIDQQQADAFLPLLSDKQRSKMKRLPTVERQVRYVAGRGFLYQLLQVYLHTEHFSLGFGEHGKPYLLNPTIPLSFNFSDTCGRGLFAFALDCELGVDLESQARQGRFARVIQRRFAPSEQKVIDPQDTQQFLACWTRKEAYGKALGVGLNYPLREHVLCEKLEHNTVGTADAQWCLQQFNLPAMPEDFIACLTSAGAEPKTIQAMRLAP